MAQQVVAEQMAFILHQPMTIRRSDKNYWLLLTGENRQPLPTHAKVKHELFRFGHTMVPDKIVSANGRLSVDNSLDLKDSYFDPDLMHRGSVYHNYLILQCQMAL